MKAKSHRKVKRTHAKTILRLPDLDIAKDAVKKSGSGPKENERLCVFGACVSIGRLRRQQCIETAACKATEIAADRPARHLKTPSNDGCADPPQAAQNG